MVELLRRNGGTSLSGAICRNNGGTERLVLRMVALGLLTEETRRSGSGDHLSIVSTLKASAAAGRGFA